jgi:hypothetical protein
MNLVDLAGFEPAASSVRWAREGMSASSAAYFRGFYPHKILKIGVKTVKKSVFNHTNYIALHTVAHGMKRKCRSDPVLRRPLQNLLMDYLESIPNYKNKTDILDQEPK